MRERCSHRTYPLHETPAALSYIEGGHVRVSGKGCHHAVRKVARHRIESILSRSEDHEPDGYTALPDEVERLRCAARHVDDHSFSPRPRCGPAVHDPYVGRPPVLEVRDTHDCSERQDRMRGYHGVHVEGDAAGSLFSVEPDAVIRRQPAPRPLLGSRRRDSGLSGDRRTVRRARRDEDEQRRQNTSLHEDVEINVRAATPQASLTSRSAQRPYTSGFVKDKPAG
jgi:hypothetical protein